MPNFFPFPFFRIRAFPGAPDKMYTRYPGFTACTFLRYPNKRLIGRKPCVYHSARELFRLNFLVFSNVFPESRSPDAFLSDRGPAVIDPRSSGRYGRAIDFSHATDKYAITDAVSAAAAVICMV